MKLFKNPEVDTTSCVINFAVPGPLTVLTIAEEIGNIAFESSEVILSRKVIFAGINRNKELNSIIKDWKVFANHVLQKPQTIKNSLTNFVRMKICLLNLVLIK